MTSTPPSALLVLGALLAGCSKPTPAAQAQGDDGSSDAAVVFAASAAPDDIQAGSVAPPAPVVAEDPNIPLHESVVGAPPTAPDYAAPVAPPEQPVAEDQPPQPDPADTWVPGYWWWSPPLARYVWVGGAWRRPPPDVAWSPGTWTPVEGRFVWSPGYWGPPHAPLVSIDVAPPAFQVEVAPPAPAVGFAWTPGYYAYRNSAYVWVGGSWLRPPAVGLGWVEPRYVSVGARFAFLPGRWDFPAERRGVVYRPDINIRAGEHLRLVAAPREILVARTHYCDSAARFVARGAVRTPGGGFALRDDRPGHHDEFHRDHDHDRDRPGWEHHGEVERREGERREGERHEEGRHEEFRHEETRREEGHREETHREETHREETRHEEPRREEPRHEEHHSAPEHAAPAHEHGRR
jgi:hypothetical protein